jgi:hypothetical protein
MTGGNKIDTFNYVATTEDPQLTLDLRGLDFPNLMKIEIVYDNDVNNDEHFFWRKADEPFNAERGANWSTANGHKRRVLILDPKKVDFLRISIGTKKGANVRIESLRVEAVDPKAGADALSSLHIHDGGLKVISDQYIAGKIKTDKPGLLFVSVPFSVGWSATVNGRPAQIEKANIALIGIPVGAGTSEVTLSYFPPGLMQGLLVSGLSLLATIALFWRFPRIKMSGDFEQRP